MRITTRAAGLAWALAALLAYADDTARIEPLLARSHVDAVIPAVIQFTGSGPIVEGQLEIELMQEGVTLARCELRDQYLGGGPRRTAVLLPALSAQVFPNALVEIRLSFRTGRSARELGRWPLGAIDSTAAQVSVLVATGALDSEQGLITGARRWLAPIKWLGPRDPADGDSVRSAEPRVWVSAHPVEDLPSNAFAYGAADLVLMSDSAAARLAPTQLEAIERWVRCGGRLGILAGPELATSPTCKRLGLDGIRADSPIADRLVRRELGAVRLLAPEELGTPDAIDGVLDGGAIAPGSRCLTPPDSYGVGATWVSAAFDEDPTRRLAPLPLSVLIGVYAAFLVWIVFVDGLVLRRLSRRATWLAFPFAVALAVWAILELPARRYAALDPRRRLLIEDIGSDGQVLRRCEIALSIPARSETVELDEQGVTTVLEDLDAIGNPWYRAHLHSIGAETETSDVASYIGSVGGHFGMRVDARQWSPMMVQRLTLDAGAPSGSIDWAAFDQRVRAALAKRALTPGALADPQLGGEPFVHDFPQDVAGAYSGWQTDLAAHIHQFPRGGTATPISAHHPPRHAFVVAGVFRHDERGIVIQRRVYER